MRFAFIAQHRGVWQTRQLCQALEVSRAGFYEWLRRPESRRTRTNRELLASIRFFSSLKTERIRGRIYSAAMKLKRMCSIT